MSVVDKLFSIYQQCREDGMDTTLCLELKSGVEMFSFTNILLPSSDIQLKQGKKKKRYRRNRKYKWAANDCSVDVIKHPEDHY